MTSYRPLSRTEIHPATYLPGMDPDDPLPVRRDGRGILIGIAGVLIAVALALVAVAAGWA